MHCSETAVNSLSDTKDPIHLQGIEDYDSDSDDIEFENIAPAALQCGDNQVFINPLLLEGTEIDCSSIDSESDDCETGDLMCSITCYHNDSKVIINPSLLQGSLFETSELEFNDLIDSSLEHMSEANEVVAKANLFKSVTTFLYLLLISMFLSSETVCLN